MGASSRRESFPGPSFPVSTRALFGAMKLPGTSTQDSPAKLRSADCFSLRAIFHSPPIFTRSRSLDFGLSRRMVRRSSKQGCPAAEIPRDLRGPFQLSTVHSAGAEKLSARGWWPANIQDWIFENPGAFQGT